MAHKTIYIWYPGTSVISSISFPTLSHIGYLLFLEHTEHTSACFLCLLGSSTLLSACFTSLSPSGLIQYHFLKEAYHDLHV